MNVKELIAHFIIVFLAVFLAISLFAALHYPSDDMMSPNRIPQPTAPGPVTTPTPDTNQGPMPTAPQAP